MVIRCIFLVLLGLAVVEGTRRHGRSIVSANTTDPCGTMCLPATESCCPDAQQGPICCLKETTWCCPRVGVHPSRCCPRWTVCCSGGRDGCCAPDGGSGGWGSSVSTPKVSIPSSTPATTTSSSFPPVGAVETAYALFMKATLVDTTPIKAAKIDVATGHQTEVKLTGGQKLDWGEMTRIFAYDSTHNVFYLLQANFTAKAASPEDPKYPVMMYAAHPNTGAMKGIEVKGATNWVSGYYYNEGLQKIVLATYKYTAGKKSGYNFYNVDPSTGSATLTSTTTFTAGADNYMGWFHSGTADGHSVYRLGFEDPVAEAKPGMGITSIASHTATSTWNARIPYPNNLGMYLTLSHINDTEFISLAPDDSGHLSVIRWGLDGSPASIVASTNCSLPRQFGPVWQAVSPDGSTFIAVVVKIGNDPIGVTDRWEEIVVDIIAKTSAVRALKPDVSGATAGMSGVGIPK